MRPSGLIRAIAVLTVLSGQASGAQASPKGRSDETVPVALEWSEGRVFQIKTLTGGNPQFGTAILLAESDGFGVFATCYHVLQGANGFEVRDREGLDGLVATSASPGTQFYRSWNRDLVLLKTKLLNTPVRRQPLFSSDDIRMDAGKSRVAVLPKATELREARGWAAGFPFATDRKPLAVEVRIQSARQMVALGLIRPDHLSVAPQDGDDRDVTVGRAGVLSRDLTFPGMSGGPIVDEKRRLGGILFGRGSGLLGLVGLIVPGEDVVDALSRANHGRGEAWREFSAVGFTAPLPFREDVSQQSADPRKWVNDLDWTSLSGWIGVFQDRPSVALTRFHEVSVEVGELRRLASRNGVKADAPVSVRALAPTDNEQIAETSAVLNGRTFPLGVGQEHVLSLVRGENLLVLHRKAPFAQIVLNDLFKPVRLAVEFCVGGVPVLTVQRSLPSAIRGFPVFVTLIDDESVNPDRQPANGRVAVRLDELSGILRQVPLRLLVDVKDNRGSFAKGSVSLRDQPPPIFSMLSEQTLGVELTTALHIEQARANLPVLQVSARNKTLGGRLVGRIQFPRRLDSLEFFSARFHGMDSSDTVLVRLPVAIEAQVQSSTETAAPDSKDRPSNGPATSTEGLDFDLSGVLRLALMSFLNNQFLGSAEAENPPLAQARALVKSATPIEALPGWLMAPKELELRRTADGTEWLVFTFLVASEANSDVTVTDKLLPQPDRLATTTLELFMRVAPVAAARRFMTIPGGVPNPLWEHLFGNDGGGPMASEVRLRIGPGKTDPLASVEPVDLPDKKNRLPGALRLAVDARLERRPIELSATLRPDSLRGALRHLLPQKFLKTVKVEGEGELSIQFRRDTAGAILTLTGNDRPMTLAGEGELELPDGVTLKDPSLTLTGFRLEGDLTKGTVKGTVSGHMKCARAMFASRIIAESELEKNKKTPAGGAFRATLDTGANPIFSATVTEPKGSYIPKSGKSAVIPGDPFTIRLEAPDGEKFRVRTDFLSKVVFD